MIGVCCAALCCGCWFTAPRGKRCVCVAFVSNIICVVREVDGVMGRRAIGEQLVVVRGGGRWYAARACRDGSRERRRQAMCAAGRRRAKSVVKEASWRTEAVLNVLYHHQGCGGGGCGGGRKRHGAAVSICNLRRSEWLRFDMRRAPRALESAAGCCCCWYPPGACCGTLSRAHFLCVRVCDCVGP